MWRTIASLVALVTVACGGSGELDTDTQTVSGEEALSRDRDPEPCGRGESLRKAYCERDELWQHRYSVKRAQRLSDGTCQRTETELDPVLSEDCSSSGRTCMLNSSGVGYCSL